jgi:hypothetical protein
MEEEKPTVQMDDAYDDSGGYQESETPKTRPADDAFPQQNWPAFEQQEPATPSPFPPQPSWPPEPPPEAAPSGATVVMGPAPPAPHLAWVAVVKGPGAERGQVFTLRDETIIGRKTGQVILPGDAHISSQHAKIRREASEEDEERQVFVLYDLASTNGTFAGGRDDYEENQVYRYELEDGDLIQLGDTTLVFKAVAPLDDD